MAGSIYLGGYTTQKVWKLKKADLSKIGESIDYGGSIYAIAEDGDFIYVGGDITQKVWKLKKADLSKIAESQSVGGPVWAFAIDSTYIYASSDEGTKLFKFLKSDLTKVAESPIAMMSYTIVEDGDYLYLGAWSGESGFSGTVQKVRKFDLVIVAESENFYPVTYVYAMVQDANYLYVGGNYSYGAFKLLKSDLTKVGENTDYNADVDAMAGDDDFIYIGSGGQTEKLWKLQKSDMAKVGENATLDGVLGLVVDGLYVYSAWERIHKLLKSDLTQVKESDNYGDIIYALAEDDIEIKERECESWIID